MNRSTRRGGLRSSSSCPCRRPPPALSSLLNAKHKSELTSGVCSFRLPRAPRPSWCRDADPCLTRLVNKHGRPRRAFCGRGAGPVAAQPPPVRPSVNPEEKRSNGSDSWPDRVHLFLYGRYYWVFYNPSTVEVEEGSISRGCAGDPYGRLYRWLYLSQHC